MDLRGICYLNPPGLQAIAPTACRVAMPSTREQQAPITAGDPRVEVDPSRFYRMYASYAPPPPTRPGLADATTFVLLGMGVLFTGLAMRQTRALAALTR